MYGNNHQKTLSRYMAPIGQNLAHLSITNEMILLGRAPIIQPIYIGFGDGCGCSQGCRNQPHGHRDEDWYIVDGPRQEQNLPYGPCQAWLNRDKGWTYDRWNGEPPEETTVQERWAAIAIDESGDNW